MAGRREPRPISNRPKHARTVPRSQLGYQPGYSEAQPVGEWEDRRSQPKHARIGSQPRYELQREYSGAQPVDKRESAQPQSERTRTEARQQPERAEAELQVKLKPRRGRRAMIALVAMIVVLAAAYLFAAMPGRSAHEALEPFEQTYIAHRGLFDNDTSAPENSIPAFDKAIEEGYAIELDVQLTADGTVVVTHDRSQLRVAGVDKPITEMTDEEVSKLHLFGTDQGIPTFEQALEFIDGQVPLLVEVKVGEGGDAAGLAQATAEILDDYDGCYVVQSFNPFVLQWYKKNRPDVVRGILAADFPNYEDPEAEEQVTGVNSIVLSNMLTNVIARPNFINYEVTGYGQPTFAIVRTLSGVDCFAWTIRSPDDLARAESVGAQGIVFDSFVPER